MTKKLEWSEENIYKVCCDVAYRWKEDSYAFKKQPENININYAKSIFNSFSPPEQLERLDVKELTNCMHEANNKHEWLKYNDLIMPHIFIGLALAIVKKFGTPKINYPEKQKRSDGTAFEFSGWNACIDEMKKLNNDFLELYEEERKNFKEAEKNRKDASS